jgi:WD40 repeat protein
MMIRFRHIITMIVICIVVFSDVMAQTQTEIYLIVAANPTGDLLSGVGTQGIAHILDTQTKEIIVDMSLAQPTSIWSVAWSSDGKQIAFADVEGTIYIYCTDQDITSACTFGEMLYSWYAQVPDILDIDWNPDNTQIAIGSQDNLHSISIWDIGTQQRVAYTSGLSPIDISWSPDGKWLAFANVDFGVGYIDVNTFINGGQPATITVFGTIRDATAVAWNSTSSQIAIAEGSAAYPENTPIFITIWDLDLNASVATLTAHNRTIEGLSWSADDQYLASVGFDAQVIIWDLSHNVIVNRYQDGLISIFGVTWIGNTHQIAFGGKPDEPPTIVDVLALSASK